MTDSKWPTSFFSTCVELLPEEAPQILKRNSQYFRSYLRKATVTEGGLEIDKHYSLELCFSIENQPETVWRGGCLA